MKRLRFFICLAISLSSASAQAGTIVLNATDSGAYLLGAHASTIENYTATRNGILGFNTRNFFTFDLSGVTDPIVAATLRLENQQTTASGFESTYNVFDVDTSISDLTSGHVTALPIYADLGSGDAYGSILIDSSLDFSVAEIPLNASALTDLNLSAGGNFALGGALSGPPSIGFLDLVPRTAFALSNQFSLRQLVLQTHTPVDCGPVPEPATFAMFGMIGLATLVGAHRKKRKCRLSQQTV